MTDNEFRRFFAHEIAMTDAWLHYQSGEADAMQLFRIQAETGMENKPPRRLLAGRIEQWSISAGIRNDCLAVYFDLSAIRQKIRQCTESLNRDQHAIFVQKLRSCGIPDDMDGNVCLTGRKDEMTWLPSISEVVSLGIIGLYDRYREEKEEWINYPVYINLLNDMIDRYKYQSCRQIVEDGGNQAVQRIYQSLGRIKYLPPRGFQDALQMILLHMQIFRIPVLSGLDRLLQPYFENDRFNNSVSPDYQAALLAEFVSKYRFCIYTVNGTPNICLEGTNNINLNQVIQNALETDL